MSIRNLLLTGASGSIGKKIFDELFQKKSKYAIRLLLRDSKKNRILFKKYKDDIEIIWGDLLNPLDIQKAVKNIEIIIHAAGVIPISKYNNPTNTYAVNVEGTKYLLSAVEQQKISPKVIYTSSIAVYGERLENPWIRISDPINPTYGDYYAESKVEAEKLIQDSKLDYCILRLSYCASTDILKFHPMLFRIPLITNIEIIGISDVAKVIVNILERNDIWGKIFNLGGGKECRIKYGDHLADLLEIIGLSRDFFPQEAFSKDGYQCGLLYPENPENIINFPIYTLQDFYRDVKKWVGFKRYLTPIVKWILRKYLLRRSVYYKKYKNKKQKEVDHL